MVYLFWETRGDTTGLDGGEHFSTTWCDVPDWLVCRATMGVYPFLSKLVMIGDTFYESKKKKKSKPASLSHLKPISLTMLLSSLRASLASQKPDRLIQGPLLLYQDKYK